MFLAYRLLRTSRNDLTNPLEEVGLGILGAAASARGRGYYHDDYDDGGCYRGPRRCGWENRRCFENRYGDLVCRGGDYVCTRPLICD